MPKAMEAPGNHRLETGRNGRLSRRGQETAERASGREEKGMDGGREEDTRSILSKKVQEGRGKKGR